MTIYREKSNNLYRVQLFVKGKRVATKRGFKTQAEAKKWMAEKQTEYENGTTTPTQKEDLLSFDTLVEKYQNLHLPKIRIQTQETYLSNMNTHIIPYFRYYKLKNITPAMITEFQTDLVNKGLKPKTVNNCVCLLKSIFNFGEQNGLFEKNPARHIKKLKIPTEKYVWWEKEEDVQKFLAAINTQNLSNGNLDPFRAAYRLALECGLRLSEVIGLSKQDVDFTTGQIHIHRQWLSKKQVYGPTKHNQIRYIGFDPNGELAKALREAVTQSPDPEILFVSSTGHRIHPTALSSKYFRYWVKKLNLPTLSFHGLRHTFASWFMKRGGGDIWQLMKFLGHSEITTTMRYAHLSSDIKRVPSFDLAK